MSTLSKIFHHRRKEMTFRVYFRTLYLPRFCSPPPTTFPQSFNFLPPADSLDVIGFARVAERQLPVFRQCPSTCTVLHGNPSIPPTARVPSLIRWDNCGGRGAAGSCRPRWEVQSRVQRTWHEMRPPHIILGNLGPAERSHCSCYPPVATFNVKTASTLNIALCFYCEMAWKLLIAIS